MHPFEIKYGGGGGVSLLQKMLKSSNYSHTVEFQITEFRGAKAALLIMSLRFANHLGDGV